MSRGAYASFLTIFITLFVLVGSAPPQERQPEKETTAEKPAKVLAGYTVLVVQKFSVDPKAAQAGFDENRAKLLQAQVVVQLSEKKLFRQVLDGSGLPATQPASEAPQEAAKPDLLLSATVTDFAPGSRAKRYWVGFGAGAAKLKMAFAFRDAATGKVLLQTEHQHKFWIGAFGGSKTDAMNKTAEGMVKSLVDDVKQNR